MSNFLKFFLSVLAVWIPWHTAVASTPILGDMEADAERMYQYVSRRNPQFQREVAEAFVSVGRRYGVRGDVALCQAIIETGWFRFDNGTAVRPEAHNYCGLGVKKRGDSGCAFASVEEGVTAMIQHLYAYCCDYDLPDGETMVDPRFKFVKRGCAGTWEQLAGRWAMNSNYGRNILALYRDMLRYEVADMVVERIEVSIPDSLLFASFAYEATDSINVE